MIMILLLIYKCKSDLNWWSGLAMCAQLKDITSFCVCMLLLCRVTQQYELGVSATMLTFLLLVLCTHGKKLSYLTCVFLMKLPHVNYTDDNVIQSIVNDLIQYNTIKNFKIVEELYFQYLSCITDLWASFKHPSPHKQSETFHGKFCHG